MILIVDIDDNQANVIASTEETHFSDVKAIEIKPSKLTQTVSAFANASGGEIYLGIDETNIDSIKKRSWRGFLDIEAANAHIHTIEQLKPLGRFFEATFFRCQGHEGFVLKIEIFKTMDIINASDGHAYIRKNAGKVRVDTPDALTRLKLDKGIINFEDELVNIESSDISNSIALIEFLFAVVPTVEPEDWLRKQVLIIDGKPTVSGTLLFHDEPQAALPKRSAVKIYRYKTRSEEGARETLAFDPITVEGCAYKLIYSAVEKTKSIIEGIQKLTERGLESIIYPHETLHEIITNSILHRDYSIAADVQIRIYDNRVEVHSPGKLPGHVTTSNILREQAARNGRLVRIINKFPNPPNKDVGEGLNTAFKAMKAVKLKEPEILETENSVIVNIRHTPLASPQVAVMEYLANHEEITNSIARELTGITSENSMKEVFYALKKSMMIEPVPGKRGKVSAWRKWTGTVHVERELYNTDQ